MKQRKDNLKKEDLNLLKFLSKYKMLKIEDGRYIYKTKRYYRQKINNLIDKNYIKKYKNYVLISKNGRKILGSVRHILHKKYE